MQRAMTKGAGDATRVRAQQKRIAARIFYGVQHRGSFCGDRLLTQERRVRDDKAFRRAITTANDSTGMIRYSSPDGIT